MRISDWSSDVCSSDLLRHGKLGLQPLYLRRLLDRLLQVLLRLLHVAGTGEGGAVQRIGAPVRGFVVDDGLQRRDRTLRVVRPKLRGGVELAGERAPRHRPRSEEHTSELQSLMRISYAVFCLK